MKILLQTLTIVFLAVNIVMNSVSPVYCEEEKQIDEKTEQLEHMKKYAAEIEKDLNDALDCLDEQRTFFTEDEDQQNYVDYNKSILEMKQFEIDLMKKMMKAALDNDRLALERLEEEKNKISQEVSVIEFKKEKEYTINYYNKEYSDYLDDEKISSGIELIEEAYNDVIAAQEALYDAELNLKNAYDKKEKASKLMEVYLLEAQKNKKIKELSE